MNLIFLISIEVLEKDFIFLYNNNGDNMERQTYLEIDSKAFIHNINIIKELVKPKEIMPVIKANAYGTHINKNLNLIKNFNIVAVAIVKEAIELRNLGFKNEIFVLNQPFKEEIADIIKYNITIGVASYNFLEELIKTKKNLKIHLELETGMGRTGINYEDLNKFIEKLEDVATVEKKPKLEGRNMFTILAKKV